MSRDTLETIRQWMAQESSPQLLMDGETLVVVNPYAGRLFPHLREGMTPEEVFGTAVEFYREYQGTGSMMFSGALGDMEADFYLTQRTKRYCLVEVRITDDAAAAATARAIAGGLLTPLSTVMALKTKLLPLLTEQEAPQMLEWTAQMNRGLYSLLRVANQLRDYGTISVQRQFRMGRRDICAWLERFCQRLEPLCVTAQRELIVKRPERGYLCYFDAELMEQALLNVVSNAIKFTEPGGRIEIVLSPMKAMRIRITVRDDGCGIAPDQMGRIYSRMESAEPMRDPKWGVGMGLPLTRRILQGHGGSVMVASEPGKGTAVHLVLERMAELPPLELRDEIRQPDGGVPPMLVALADVLPDSAFDTRDVDG